MPINFDQIISDLKANPAIPLAGVAAGVGLFFLYKRGNLGGGSSGGIAPTAPGSSGTPGAPSADSGLADQVASLAQQLAQTTAADQKALAEQAAGQAGFAKQITDFVNGALGQISDAINGQNSGVQSQIDTAVSGLQSQIQSELAQLNGTYSTLGQPAQSPIPLSMANKTPSDLSDQIAHLGTAKDAIQRRVFSTPTPIQREGGSPRRINNQAVIPANLKNRFRSIFPQGTFPRASLPSPVRISRPNPGFDPRAYLANLGNNRMYSTPTIRVTPSPQPRSSQIRHTFTNRTRTYAQSQQAAWHKLTGG